MEESTRLESKKTTTIETIRNGTGVYILHVAGNSFASGKEYEKI